MATIVISYRREDSKWVTGRIFDHLEDHFGHGHVFMDIDNIPYGRDFRTHLTETLEKCDVLVAVVGPNWAGKSEKFPSRLHDETDWLRLEISTALKKGVPVIPVLIDGTPMPDASSLPEDLKDFSFRQGAPIDSGPTFRASVDRISRSIDDYLISKEALAAVENAIRSGPAGTDTGSEFQPPPTVALPPAGGSTIAHGVRDWMARIGTKLFKTALLLETTGILLAITVMVGTPFMVRQLPMLPPEAVVGFGVYSPVVALATGLLAACFAFLLRNRIRLGPIHCGTGTGLCSR